MKKRIDFLMSTASSLIPPSVFSSFKALFLPLATHAENVKHLKKKIKFIILYLNNIMYKKYTFIEAFKFKSYDF